MDLKHMVRHTLRPQGRANRPSPTDPTELLSNLKHSWELLGRGDPLSVALSAPDKHGERWDIQEFLEVGETEIRDVMSYVATLPGHPKTDRALDFGCGAGRHTRPLSEHYSVVDGVDVSQSMLELAQRLNHDRPACRFTRIDGTRLPFDDAVFDLVYSRLVLQHMPTSLAMAYVEEFMRVLQPSGLAIFRVPCILRTPGAADRPTPIRLTSGKAEIEIHAHARETVEQTIKASGGHTIDVIRDDSARDEFENVRYTVTK